MFPRIIRCRYPVLLPRLAPLGISIPPRADWGPTATDSLFVLRRVIGLHDLLDLFPDAGFLVGVGGFHEVFEGFQELFLVEGQRLSDIDQVVVRLPQAFLDHEFLFIELFAGTQARVFDLDVDVRFESGKPDQVSGEISNLHRRSHVQHEDLPAVGVGACQHDQGNRLRNGHEVTDDVRMGNRDGAALLDLLFEDRDNGAVGAQDIAEADGDEFRFDVFKLFLVFFFADVLQTFMGEDLRDLICFVFLDLLVKGLDDHLAQALACAHDVRGVHGLVRGDQDKALASVDHGRIGGLVGTDRVVLDGFAGTVLHERDMLVRGGVVNDLRPVGFKDFEHPAAVSDGADEGNQVQFRILLLQLQLDAVGVVFVNIKDDQLLRLMGRDLPAQFGADGSAAAGDQDGLAGDKRKDFRHVSFDGFPAQQIFDRHVFHGAYGNITQDELVQAGKLLELAARLVADGKDIPLLLDAGAGDRQEDLVDIVLRGRRQDLVPTADDRDAVHVPVPFVFIIVDDTDDLVLDLVRPGHIPEDHLAGAARADQHDPFALHGFVAFFKDLDEPETEAHHHQEESLEKRAEDVIRDRHPPDEDGNQDHVEDRGCDGTHAGPHEL